MNMAADSHQLLQFAIENDDTDLIHVFDTDQRTYPASASKTLRR